VVTKCSCVRVKLDEIVIPTRRFLMEANLTYISKGKSQEMHFVLFNDSLIFGRVLNKKKEQYQFKDKLDLALTVASDIMDSESTKARMLSRLALDRNLTLISLSLSSPH